ncbi:hypothetical protein HYH03_001229 [Edaphochlamys debaryana]|uniref:SRCR domain-containing protein n=1 Tax=Edaphochlamys debaryana TaxID=47281 RepID=A0A836C5P9_9CHLO|nr:hypothetical protein HYH03_001229 [Edaphochlamys debaryana]|eukprot:KAG2501446.1 hypothetical protein HYH03_001229 [Edaphochlamys debaryana]
MTRKTSGEWRADRVAVALAVLAIAIHARGGRAAAAPAVVDGALQLINPLPPSSNTSGAGVLLLLHSGEWRPVCDDGFGAAEAYVACGQLLGFPEWYGPGNAGQVVGNTFWVANASAWLDQVACNGTEARLTDCWHSAWGVSDCVREEAVAVSCPTGPRAPPAPPDNDLQEAIEDAGGAGGDEPVAVDAGVDQALPSHNATGHSDGELRLVGGSTPSEGRLEVAYRQQWGTVCGFMFGPEDARVACRALGLPHEGAQVLDARVFSQLGTPGDLGNPAQAPPIWLDNLGCSGTETSLTQCPSNGWGVSGCTHLQNVGLRCAAAASGIGSASNSTQGSIRLRLDSPPSGGRVAGVVEVLHKDTWGRICLTPATTAATYAVLCRELGYEAEGAAPEPGLSRDLKHRTTYRPFWLADVACGGGEASVRHCRSLGWGAHSCDPLGFHEQPLALSCALPAGANSSVSASDPALATPPVIPPPARTGANETAVCALTLIGRGSAEELSQASAFGEDSQLLSASLHCRTASGAPLPVAAGKRLADLLNITAGSHSGVSLTQRMQAGNDTALDEEWGLTFSGLEALALVDSVVRDIRLSRAGPLLQFVDCATLALTNVTLTRLYGAKVYKSVPSVLYDTAGSPTDVRFFCRPAYRIYGPLFATGLGTANLTNVACSDVMDSHGWSCFYFRFQSDVPVDAASGPSMQLNMTNCSITGNTVAYGGFYDTSWYDDSVSNARFNNDPIPCLRESVGYGAIVVTSEDAPAVGLQIVVKSSELSFNSGHRGSALSVLPGQLKLADGFFGVILNMTNGSLVGNAARAHEALWWPEWPCDASFSGGALYLASTQRDVKAYVELSNQTRVLRNSAARDGGAVYSSMMAWTAVLNASQLAHNNATCGDGGAISSDCFQDTTFGIFPDVRFYLYESSAVFNNSAGGNGGALDVAWSGISLLAVRESVLVRNTASGSAGGGALRVGAAFIMVVQVMNSSHVSYNTATKGDGGAITGRGFGMSTSDTSVASAIYVYTMNDTTLQGNRALQGAGGVGNFEAFQNMTLGFNRTWILDNSARASGGAFNVEPLDGGNYNMLVISSIVSGNTCGVEGLFADGGAFSTMEQGAVLVRNSTFVNNSASGDGGTFGILGFCQHLSIGSSTFAGNTAGKSGGVVAVKHPGVEQLDISDSHVLNNTAVGSGGALSLLGTYAAAADFRNTTIEGNRALTAGGGAIDWQVRIPDAHPLAGGTLRSPVISLTATTLRNNQASFGQGGGLFVRPRAPALPANATGHRPNMTILIRNGSLFEGNTAAGSGAGLNLLASRQELDVFVAVDQSWFVSNRAGDSVSSVTGSGASGGGISLGYTGSVDAGSPSACGLLVSRSTFYGNRCGGGGGGALVLTSCVANVTMSTFNANTASYEGGAISLAEEEIMTAPGVTTVANVTAVFPWGPGENTTAARRRLTSLASYGAPYVPYGSGGQPYALHVEFSSFTNCTSVSAAGGAVYTRVRGLLRLASTKFISCSAGVYGGAVASAFSLLNVTDQSADSSTPRLDISGGSFVANTADADGGALIVNWAGLLRVRQTRFEGNVAGYGDKGRGTGGAICMVVQAPQQPDVLRAFASGSGGESSDASAAGGGGAIVLDVEGSAFTNNSCTSSETAGGGAIFAGFESTGLPANPLPLLVSLTGCELTGNTANGGSGGALFAANWRLDQPTDTTPSGAVRPPLSVQILHCDVSRNSADQQGGAVTVGRSRTTASRELPPRLLLLNSTLADNRAGADGGALSAMLDGGQVEISASSFTGNLCRGQGPCGGGAVYIDSAAAVAIQHTFMAGNQASMGGGLAVIGVDSSTANASSTSAAAARRRAKYGRASAGGLGTALLLYGTVLYGNVAWDPDGDTDVLRGGGLFLDGSVAAALVNCDLAGSNNADWGAALASTQTCLPDFDATLPNAAISVSSSLPWSGAVARSAVWTWALLERARGVGCWMLGLYDTLLPSHAVDVLRMHLQDANSTGSDPSAEADQTVTVLSDDATGMPLYLTDTSASSLAVSCRPEDTGTAAPSVVPASASGNVSQQLAAAEAGLWLVADSFLVGTVNTSLSTRSVRGQLLLSSLEGCRELSYISAFGAANRDKMNVTLDDESVAYLGLAPNTLRVSCINATDGSAKAVLPYTGAANISAAKGACMEPAVKTGRLTLQMGALYDIRVEMVDGLGERLTAAEGEYLVRVSIVPEMPGWLGSNAGALAWARSREAAVFASIQAIDLSVNLYQGVALFDQVSLNGWPGYYYLSIRAESNIGNATELATQVPVYITPCNPGERLDVRRSLTSCIVCTDDQYSFWTDSRPDLQVLINSTLAELNLTTEENYSPTALSQLPGVVTEKVRSWVSKEQAVSVCNNCPEGAFCPGGATVVPLPGYWHSAANSTQMHKCPHSEACQGFWTAVNITDSNTTSAVTRASSSSSAPSFRATNPETDPRVRGLRSCESLWYAQWPPGASVLADPSASQSDMEQGDSPTACLLWGVQAHHPNSYMQQQCADGFGGRACTVCQKGHYTTPEFECEKCQSVLRSAVLGVLTFLASVVLGLYTVWTNLREGEEAQAGEGGEERITAGDVLKAALVHCQIFVTVTRLNLEWPNVIAKFQGALRSASGAESAFSYSPSCLFPEADATEAARIQTMTGLIQPLLVIGVVGVLWALRWLIFGRKAWRHSREGSSHRTEDNAGPSTHTAAEGFDATLSQPHPQPNAVGRPAPVAEATESDGGGASQAAEAAAGNTVPTALLATQDGSHKPLIIVTSSAENEDAPREGSADARRPPLDLVLESPNGPGAASTASRIPGQTSSPAATATAAMRNDPGVSAGSDAALLQQAQPQRLPSLKASFRAGSWSASARRVAVSPVIGEGAAGGSASGAAPVADLTEALPGDTGREPLVSQEQGPRSSALLLALQAPSPDLVAKAYEGNARLDEADPAPRDEPPTQPDDSPRPAHHDTPVDAGASRQGSLRAAALGDPPPPPPPLPPLSTGKAGAAGSKEATEAEAGEDKDSGDEQEEGPQEEGGEPKKRRRRKLVIDETLSLPRQLAVVVFVVVFILYSGWAQAALSIFACYSLDDGTGPYAELQQATSDSGYWMTNMDLACYAGEHATLYVPVGIVAVLLVCAGPPIASAILLYMHRDKLDERTTQLVYGFMYMRYKRQWWWWESVVQLQMLALVVVDVFGRALSITQQAIVMLLSMSVISAINVACAPLSHPALILLDFASMAVLSATVLLGLFAADVKTASEDNIIGVMIVLINVMLLAAFVGLIIYSSRDAVKNAASATRRVRQALGDVRQKAAASGGFLGLRLRRRVRAEPGQAAARAAGDAETGTSDPRADA